MGLPVLSSNCVQLLWTPWAIWRGQRAYDSTTLAPLALAPQYLGTGDLITGKNSLFTYSGFSVQDKYDNNKFLVKEIHSYVKYSTSEYYPDCKIYSFNGNEVTSIFSKQYCTFLLNKLDQIKL